MSSAIDKPTRPTAEPCRGSRYTKARRYSSITRVLVEPIGPPCVISQIRSKRRRDQMLRNSASSATEGCMVGQTTARNTLSRCAPSITAASRSSEETPCSAARMTTAANGKICQMVVSNTAGKASAGLSSQLSTRADPPSAPSRWLKRQYWPLTSQPQTSATATGGAAQGIVTNARARPRPRNGASSSSAAPRPSAIAATTPTTVKIDVILQPDKHMLVGRQQRGRGEAKIKLLHQRIALEQQQIKGHGRGEPVWRPVTARPRRHGGDRRWRGMGAHRTHRVNRASRRRRDGGGGGVGGRG